MKKLTSLILLLFAGYLFLFAQEKYIPLDTLAFANFKADTFYFSMDTSLLIPFFAKYDSVIMTKSGNINIVQIGGSHVQAGTFSNRIRRNILSEHTDLIAGRGMIFPYSVAKKCNNPADYKVCKTREFSLIRNVYQNIEKPLGVTGIAVYTRDTVADITIKMNDKEISYTTDLIYILGYSDTGNVVPSVWIDSVEYKPIEIDTAARRFIYKTTPFKDSFLIKIPCDSNSVFTLTGILLENQTPGITFHSLGVNGASVGSYLKCEYFGKDMELLKPDMVVFGLGINDAADADFDTLQFEKEYLLLIDRIKEVNPNCVFVFITNNDSFKRVSKGKYAVNKNGILAQGVFYKLAAQTGGAVWDQFAIMGGLKSMDKWRLAELAQKDRVHFTHSGYNLLGDLFYNAFINAKNKCAALGTDSIQKNKLINNRN